ncbi:MAG TPA: hypothetical protein VFE28_00500 [Candidatus Krumholzibacteria bacterium]|nr:hypothetical protein [Candidatus Krumholzibacteria bacterium]
MQLRRAGAVACLSGFVALGYEILWARRLSDIIGATALASSLVVGVFFLSLAAGAARLGPLASRHASPWRLYGQLELGILVCILPSFFGEQLSGIVARALGPVLLLPTAGAALKACLAAVFVAPPSFLMGGTLPALGQAVVSAERLGREGNTIYGFNTLGGAGGVLVTTFFLVPVFGMRGGFCLLMLGSLALAGLGFLFARAAAPHAAPRSTATSSPRRSPEVAAWSAGLRSWGLVAALSGFIVLGLEILALHLFSQVLHNSSYTFASVLVVVIAALVVGPLVLQRAVLDERRAWQQVGVVLLLGACVTAVLPRFFVAATQGMSPFGGGAGGFATYIIRILGSAALVIGPPFVLAGWVFPLVLAGAGAAIAAQRLGETVGRTWGRLLGMNAAGALVGLVTANHLAMPALGLWGSLLAWCVVLLASGLLVAWRTPGRPRSFALGLATLACILVAATSPWTLPVAHLAPGERILAWRAGPAGVSAVLEQHGDRRIKWNNTYSLGGSANAAQQTRLGYLPLLLHPAPRQTAFIGSATGITASAALRDPSAEKLTAIELSGQTMRLACEEFRPWNADLCAHPRARAVVEDGRMFFRATRDTFDVVVGDLFVPWRSGAANLFTREHIHSVKAHLRPGGIFAQWLPLFQLDALGFWGIAATFCAEFPNAWLAIADFQPGNPAVALIGWREGRKSAVLGPDPAVLARRCATLGSSPELREPLLADPAGVAMFLVGPLRPALPNDVPLLTLNRPWLADHAPRVQRARPSRFFTGPELVATLQHIARGAPPGPLRPSIQLGQWLYAFSDVMERQGPQAASAWYDKNVTVPLPSRLFLVPQPERMSWPFSQQAGMFLLRRANAEARASTAP